MKKNTGVTTGALLRLTLLAAAFSLAIRGIDAHAEPPPDGPMLNPAPDFSQWVVTYSYEDERARKQGDAAAAANQPPMPDHLKLRPHAVTTIKTNNLVHEVIAVIDGPPQEKWYVGNIQYWKIGKEPNWVINQPGLSGTLLEGYTPVPPIGFRDLGWVSETTYSGTETYQGRPCLVFNAAGDNENKARVAYIDLKTRWPVELRIAGEVRTYQFVAPPTEMLVLPDDLKQQIALGEKVRARLDTRPQTAP